MHKYKITRPRARLEARLVAEPSFSRGFTLTHYEHSRANPRRWQRIITATDDQWLCLSGHHGTSPSEIWNMLLDDPERRALPLPMLVLGDFVAHAGKEAEAERRWLFHWVAWAIDELLRFSTLPTSTRGGTDIETEALEATTQSLVDALLDSRSVIPWPTTDGAQLQTLVHLGKLVWSFSPDLVRRLVSAFVAIDEQDMEQANRQAESLFVGPGQLLQLSGIHLWRTGIPQVRQLSFHMSTMAFPSLIQQALILMHPDAPHVDDGYLARLCNGTIGQSSDPPSPVQAVYNDAVNLPNFLPSASRTRIAALAQESAPQPINLPVSQWEVANNPRFPLFQVLNLRAVRGIALQDGCWVRLLPRGNGWGKLLWWVPQLDPHPCLAFALGTGRKHPLVWAMHETMWMFWHDMHMNDASPL